MRLYRFAVSGHAHRVELFLSLLGKDYEKVEVNLLEGEQKAPEFLRKNVFGEVPVLEDEGMIIADSNAILVWLASKYDSKRNWYPQEPKLMAEVQRWLSVASGRLAFGANHARMIKKFGMTNYNYEQAKQITEDTYTAMDRHLEERSWLVGNGATIADVACYSHIAGSGEGQIPVDSWRYVKEWMGRVEALNRFLPYPRLK